MTKRLGVVMDPIGFIHFNKDTTLAMLWEAQDRGWDIEYFELQDLFLRDGVAYGQARTLHVYKDANDWFELDEPRDILLSDLDVILMRKDPPFNEEYIYATYLLEHAERAGVLVLNKPQSLRDANEKLFATYFPECCAPTLVTRNIQRIKDFWHEHRDVVCKPLNSMGGANIFRLLPNDVNVNVIAEILTNSGSTHIMAQKFIPAIKQGDKRILLIDGNPLPFALVRVPQGDDWRGNLAVGAKATTLPITDRDRWICSQVGPVLRERGLVFVGIDVIGDYLTEINVTSPTGIREIDEQCNVNISAILFDWIERRLKSK